MYHLELRKFPHVVCRFNQSEAQLRALVLPWVRQEWVEEGERKWNVNEASLTILEGPKLSMPELAMGKGWRNAQKRSHDVTERVLDAVRQGEGEGRPGSQPDSRAGDAPPAQAGARELELLADSLALEVLALLDDDAVAPHRVWSMAHERLGGRDRDGRDASAADALALGERAVGSLLGRGLAVLQVLGDDPDPSRAGSAFEVVPPRDQETVLAAVATWAGGDRPPVVIARKG